MSFLMQIFLEKTECFCQDTLNNLKMKNLILYTGLITVILMGCYPTKDEFVPTLPPITQTGENTFGCYVNGVLITPRDGSGTFNVPDRGMILVAGPGPTEFSYQEIKVRDFASEKTARITDRKSVV